MNSAVMRSCGDWENFRFQPHISFLVSFVYFKHADKTINKMCCMKLETFEIHCKGENFKMPHS